MRIARERPLLKKEATAYAWERRRRSHSLHRAIRILLPPIRGSLIDLIGGIEVLVQSGLAWLRQSIRRGLQSVRIENVGASLTRRMNRRKSVRVPDARAQRRDEEDHP